MNKVKLEAKLWEKLIDSQVVVFEPVKDAEAKLLEAIFGKEQKGANRHMKKTRNQLRAALKNRTLDEFWGAKDLPKRLILSYTRQELKKVVSTLKILLVTSLLVLGCLGPWTAFARQPESINYSEQEIAQFLLIEAEVCQADFAPFNRSGQDLPNLAVIVHYNGHFLFEATPQVKGFTAVWDFSELPHAFYIAFYPDDVFTVYLVHVPDLGEEQRDVIEVWEVTSLFDEEGAYEEKFMFLDLEIEEALAHGDEVYAESLKKKLEAIDSSLYLTTENGSFVDITLEVKDDKRKIAEEPEEEGEGYFEADEAGIIIKSW